LNNKLVKNLIYYNPIQSYYKMSGTPTMKVMLKDMFEFIDAHADIQGFHHNESLETLQKKSNNKFLQFNIFMMMSVLKDLMDEKADTPCNECHNELKEENEKLKEQLKKGGEAHMKDKKAYDRNLKIRESELDEKDQEIKKLKELKEGFLKSERSHNRNAAQPLVKRIESLKAENEKLKAELSDFTSVFDGNVSMIQMKKENEKLKNELADVEELKQGIKNLFLKFD